MRCLSGLCLLTGLNRWASGREGDLSDEILSWGRNFPAGSNLQRIKARGIPPRRFSAWTHAARMAFWQKGSPGPLVGLADFRPIGRRLSLNGSQPLFPSGHPEGGQTSQYKGVSQYRSSPNSRRDPAVPSNAPGHAGLREAAFGNTLLCLRCVPATHRTSNGVRPKRTGSERVELRVPTSIIRRWRSPVTACGGEPSRPPVPIACNAKERRSNYNANECCVNEHGYRQRKSEHLNHEEVPEGECREYHNHDRRGARNQSCGSG